MGTRFNNPNDQYMDATPNVYSGGKLHFYVTTTSTPTNTYSNAALTVPNANPVVLDSAGRPLQEIFLDPAVTYSVVLTDSNDVVIWTRDPVGDSTSSSSSSATFTVYPGSPTGLVAGYQGSPSGSGATVIWDTTDNLLYVCTTTGTAATAVWTQVASTLSGALAQTGVISPTSLAADVNDYSPTGMSGASIMRQDTSGSYYITGLAGGTAGRQIHLDNISLTNTFILSNQDTASTAANRFLFETNVTVHPLTSVALEYDAVSSRWRRLGARANLPFGDPGGRLTLTTAVPVLQSDVTAATTVYYTPYKHNRIFHRLSTGSWYEQIFTEMSQTLADTTKSPAAAAVSSNYDMFVWIDGSGSTAVQRCTRGPAWTSGTARGTGAATTELEQVDGVWLNKIAISNGPAARGGRYVGTISTSASGANGQLNMMFAPAAAAGGSANRLDVWNMYNRVATAAMCRESTDTWTYTTATWRAKNNSNSNRITVVCGFNEDFVHVSEFGAATQLNSDVLFRIGIGLDSTSAFSGFPCTESVNSPVPRQMVAGYVGLVGLGSHYLQALEYSVATGTTTWYGDNGAPTLTQTGMQLSWMM